MTAFMAAAHSADVRQISGISARLTKLAHRLEKFSFPLVAQPLAALLIRPENHAATNRIEALLHLAALHCRGRRAPTFAQLREWMNDIIFRDVITELEDPVEDVFVSNIATWSGNVRLFEGIWPDNDYYVQTCLAALGELKERAWAAEAQDRVSPILLLSEAVAERAGIRRYTLSKAATREPLHITQSSIAEPSTHVRFSISDLFALGFSPSELDPFIFGPEDAPSLAEETLGHTSLERRPLVRTEMGVIVALPTAIGAAVRRFIIESAITASDLEGLQSEIARAQFQDVYHLGRLAWNITEVEPPAPIPSTTATDFVGTFDEGGYVHVVFVPDNLSDVAQEGLQGIHPIFDATLARIEERTSTLSARSDYCRGLTLVVHGGVGRGFSTGFGNAPPTWKRLSFAIPDFMRMGWDSRSNALRAWKLLDQRDALRERGVSITNINEFPNLYAYAEQHEFQLVPESMSAGIIALANDFVAPLRQRLRVALDQHVAVAPDNHSWVEVQRETTDVFFEETRRLPAFFSPMHLASGTLLSCVETTARAWWVECDGSAASGRHRGVVIELWKMFRNWLIPLAPALEKRLPALPEGSITFRLHFPDVTVFDDTEILHATSPVGPEVTLENDRIVITCTPPYLRTFSNSRNIGDRLAVEAMARGAHMLCSAHDTNEAIHDLVDQLVQNDDARFFHAIPARTLREHVYAGIPLPQPRLATSEDTAWSRLGLARQAGWDGGSGPIPAEESPRILHGAVLAIWERIKDRLLELDRVSIVKRALLNYYAIEHDRATWRLTAAALLALYRDTRDVLQAAHYRESDRSLAGLASRVIAEMALCTSPLTNGSVCTDTDLDYFVAEVATLLECAGQSDALHYGLSSKQPFVHSNGSFAFDISFAESIQQPYMSAHGERSFRAAATAYASAFEEREPSSINSDFDTIFEAEFGVGLHQYYEFASHAAAQAFARGEPHYEMPKSAVLRELSEFGAKNSERTFRALALMPRPQWNEEKPKHAKKRDWYPWRYNRRLSITRRPLIQLSNEDDPSILIAPTLLDGTLRNLCEASPGRLPLELFDSKEMRTWIGAAVDEGGHNFNHRVAARLRELGWAAQPEVKLTLLGGTSDLGDVDVLAWHLDSGVVYAIECKRLLFARTIGEIGERLVEYTSVSSTGERTPIQKHLDRMSYLTANVHRLSTFTSIDVANLQLRAALVTDYLVPMQFSERAMAMVDIVTDFAALDERLAVEGVGHVSTAACRSSV